MNVTDPILRVSVVSTGQVQIRLVRRPGLPPLILVGDLTYDAHLLEAGHVPGVGSRRRLREATAMINTMRQRHPGLVILPAHDPAAASRLAQATGQAPKVATA